MPEGMNKKDSSRLFKRVVKIGKLDEREARGLLKQIASLRKINQKFRGTFDFSWLRENAEKYALTSKDVDLIEFRYFLHDFIVNRSRNKSLIEKYATKCGLTTKDIELIKLRVYFHNTLDHNLVRKQCEEALPDDLLRIPLVGPVRADRFRKAGIGGIKDVVSLGLEGLKEKVRSCGILISENFIEIVYYYARAIHEGRIIIRKELPLLRRTDVSFIDLEYHPSDPFIFIIGVMDNRGRVKQWFAENEDEEREALKEFLNFIKDKNLIGYASRSSDDIMLCKCFKKHDLDANRLPEILDLYHDIIEPRYALFYAFFFPLKQKGEKEISEYLGFKKDKSVEIRGGLEALMYFNEYLKTKNSKIKEQLLKYNKEDLRRVKHVYKVLRNISLNLSLLSNPDDLFDSFPELTPSPIFLHCG
ncbi:MAG: ribonuclease H-like domain-containing protein [Thermoproteota archaeon]